MSFSNQIFDKYDSIYTIDKSVKHDTVTLRKIDDNLYECKISLSGIQRSTIRSLSDIQNYLCIQLQTLNDSINDIQPDLQTIKNRLKLRKGVDLL